MRSKLVLTHHPITPSPQRVSGAGRGRDSKAENPQIPSLQLTSFWWMEIACHKSHQFLSIQSVTGKNVIFEIESFCRYWSEGQKTTIRLQPWRHMARLSVNIPKGLAIPASMRVFDLWKIVMTVYHHWEIFEGQEAKMDFQNGLFRFQYFQYFTLDPSHSFSSKGSPNLPPVAAVGQGRQPRRINASASRLRDSTFLAEASNGSPVRPKRKKSVQPLKAMAIPTPWHLKKTDKKELFFWLMCENLFKGPSCLSSDSEGPATNTKGSAKVEISSGQVQDAPAKSIFQYVSSFHSKTNS